MKGQDWNNLGNDLNRIIENAVHMGNFGHLNESINDTIREAFPGSGEEFRSNDGWDFDLSKKKDRQPIKNSQWKSSDFKSANDKKNSGTGTRGRDSFRNTGHLDVKIFASGSKRKAGSLAMLIGGVLLAIFSLVPLVTFMLGAVMHIDSMGIGSSILFILMILSGGILITKGILGMRLASRFDQHIRSLGGDTYADVKKLSLYCHRTEKDVVKELKKMMRKGWFLQGHFDDGEKCFMVTNEAYEQYLDTMKNAKIRKEETRRKAEEEARRNGGLTPEVRAIIKKGNEYIESIRKSNDAIPGDQISEKIYRMEMLVRRIFRQTEAHPENAQDLRKLMEYYLPMTVKLLKAYEELDGQPVQGENILKSKNEIEGTLDTLNIAFEKLLDSLFQDTAWDVSSDISVLQTMLAQEGLTDDGFINK
ncbi:5-bromo-4-chloroindolyl phosphate hydrolysis family protein [Mogibacterium sp. NSJ-24]|jgi:5-bromo-4-chloroindolyl phosphate hydrolysis protein|uniref:5-bromo-4-chloroindolyl phosphate hydrolysis family protein n=1 Tax=Lentihominibacter hominis TaxID=2763645 RepID=A0A926IA03_9FIRM|nr:5-bromo-4-chloroindolyl phosphate hydrolysis family protein [Lentihominibacter hominis]MBC8568650.1 5-bromo-4-chloroindolyl phosphate hydrolysis family protein [Lentihominibacter hominis]